jgi:uncharacterized membrane-anchored protein
MWSKSAIAILLNLLLLLGYFNWSALQKEETLAKGRLVLLELAPVAPRSLMQKDYMPSARCQTRKSCQPGATWWCG